VVGFFEDLNECGKETYGHCITLNTGMSVVKSRHKQLTGWERETELHTNIVNREVHFFLNRLWQSIVHSLKERKKKLLSKDKAVLVPTITLFYLCPH